MCGIAGKIDMSGGSVSEATINRMVGTIAHRGPDGQGIYISPDRNVGLGHARLAVIDITSRGAQPMSYLDRYHIVFNGEIYNFQSERTKLQQHGYKFSSKTDTEVILALYDKYKEGCVQQLDGMFAFAIYDQKKQVLFCARDRIGKKPFKYVYTGQSFLFASELKALLSQSEVVPRIDHTAVYHYLTLQYVPSPRTGFMDIKKLEPGHYLHLDIKTGSLTKKRYWQLDFRAKATKSRGAWEQIVVSELQKAVDKRLVADVPLGAFLSGGIDSSAIVACMARNATTAVRTFSIGFGEKKYNELPYARLVADQFKTDHTEFIVEPTDTDILPTLTRSYEEPFGDSSALPMWYLAQATRKSVTVALSGDGGDEAFAGYPKYSALAFAQSYAYMMPLHRLLVAPVAEKFHAHVRSQFLERTLRFARTMSLDHAHRFTAYTSFFTEEQKRSMLTSFFQNKTRGLNTYDEIAHILYTAPAKNILEQALFADITTWLPDDLLVKTDIASMHFGLEVRSPFLDHNFMEVMASMPPGLKLRRIMQRKYILKKAFNNLLPPAIIHRPKRGFSIPLTAWLRGDLEQYARGHLLAPEAHIHEFLRRDALKDLLDAHNAGKRNYSHHLWAALMLELWLKEYF